MKLTEFIIYIFLLIFFLLSNSHLENDFEDTKNTRLDMSIFHPFQLRSIAQNKF